MANKIITLHNTNPDGSIGQDNLMPRTRIKAIVDKYGTFLSDDLTAEDLNNVHEVVANFNSLGLSVVNGELCITYEE